MSMQNFLTPARLGKFKGDILVHAMPFEVLAKQGRQVQFDKNKSDTYVARRFLPYGATASSPNTFFSNGTGDRVNAMVQAHITQEGITPSPDSIDPFDITEQIYQLSCLYGYTDKTAYLFEDNIPEQQKIQCGERTGLVNEMMIYGKVKSCTNKFYGGGGTSRATVAGPITLEVQSAVVRSLQANHAKEITTVLAPSLKYDTTGVAAGYYAYGHTDLERMIRDLPNFTDAVLYASGQPEQKEVGKCERFRYILSPDLIPYLDAGAAVAAWTGGGTGGYSTTGTNLDVYPVIVLAKDAFSQITVRGLDSMEPTFIPVGTKSSADQFGQRGYVGNMWWKGVMLENSLWMAVIEVARKI